MQSPEQRIEISVGDQKLRLIGPGGALAEYPVSTSKFGVGSEDGSQRTPTGEFVIREKIGDGQPRGTIFKSRKPIGVWGGPENAQAEGDLVLTRILWLDGCESQNANTRDRYIYIHGTNQEHLIGQPASIGCIRMRNEDVIDLYDRVAEDTIVTIV